MSAEISPILQWLNTHPHLSGLATFLISAAESVAIIGTIVPGSIMMTAIGTLAGAGVIPLWSTILWAILGAIIGDGISYRIGYYFKDRLYQYWPFKNNPQWLNNGKNFFHKHGAMSVLLGRFVGPVRALVPLVAGMMHMKALRFYIANIISAIGWAPAYMLPGIILGAASLELPPDIAVHVILMLLMSAFFIMLCLWLVYKIFVLIGNKIDQLLNRLWNRLEKSRYFRGLTAALKHHDPKKTHGQLKLAFYFLITLILFLVLTIYLWLNTSAAIVTNQMFYHFFRSVRSDHLDQLAIFVTLLGQKQILLPAFLAVCAWLAFTKRWYTTIHFFLLAVLAVASAVILKHLIHSPRPDGMIISSELYSYPSGHTTLAATFYFAIALLFIKSAHIKKRALIYYVAGFIVLAVSISRLYLGAHWFTDVLGSWLLSAVLLMFVTLSYNRIAGKKAISAGKLVLVFFTTLFIFYSAFYFYKSSDLKKQYAQIPRTIYVVSQKDWQEQDAKEFPQVRINRFGLKSETFNLEWIDNLDTIKKLLLNNGWETPPARDWMSIVYRLSDIQSTEKIPLVSAMHLDKNPVLVLIKRNEKKLMILRLWNSNFIVKNKGILWVGSVDFVPRTYSWLFRKQINNIDLSPKVIFNTLPKKYEIKTVQVKKVKKPKRAPLEQSLVLIEEKS